jgi:uncharacterized protein YlxP (DUF503 family)
MIIGLLSVELLLSGCYSLKEKRMIVKSLKDRLRNRFNISVAEVENNDKWQRATLAVAMVSSDKKYVDAQIQAILREIESKKDVQILKHEMEIE